jgi:uncharacterized protein
MFFDFGYLIWVLLPTMLISFAAQSFLSMAYGKWSKVRNGNNMTGAEIGQAIIDRTSLADVAYRPTLGGAQSGLSASGNFGRMAGMGRSGNAANLRLEMIGGQLTDHYDPRTHTVRMSQAVATQPSVMAMAVVAHELGHAEQHEQNSFLITMRNLLLPALQFTPTISYVLILAGLFLNMVGLLWLGIIMFGIMVVFSVLTLPVEIDASMRGLRLLREANLIRSEQDSSGARQMLTAAAATYIAAAITSVLQLLYYVSLAQRRN